MDHSSRLGHERISRLMVKFSIPAIVALMVQAFYNVVDRIFVGRGVGADAIAGITVCFPFMLVIMGFSALIGVGGTSLISMRLGEGRPEEAEKVLGNAMFLMVVIAFFTTVTGLIFLDPLLKIFGASPRILPYAHDYMSIVLLGTIFGVTGHGMNNFIRGEGNPRRAMSTIIIGALLNVVLDPILIFGFDMGIRGAAIATLLAQMASAVLVVSYFWSGRSQVRVHLHNFRPRMNIVRSMLAIGMAPFAMQLSSSLLNTILNHQLRIYGGDLAISVMGIMFSILMLIVMPVFGISQGSQPIIGYNYGARSFDRVRKTLTRAIMAATIWTLLGWLLAMTIPAQLMSLFAGDHPELVEMGQSSMRIFLCMLPIVGFQIISSQYFMAVGKAPLAMLLGLSRQVLILIPMLLILPRFLGLEGVWLAGPIADASSALLTAYFIRREIRSMRKMT